MQSIRLQHLRCVKLKAYIVETTAMHASIYRAFLVQFALQHENAAKERD